MSKPNFARQPSKFYPTDTPPAERVRIARREISLHVYSLKTMLTNLSQELKRMEKSPRPSALDGGLVEGLFKHAVSHSQGIYRELHEVRRAVTDHQEVTEETKAVE